MADPIEIPLVGDASSVIREAQRAGQSFEDFGDSLNDVARDAQRMGDAVGDETRDGTRTAGRALENLEKDFNQLAREAQREARKAGDALGDETRRGARRGSEAMREFKGEAIQNLSEVSSSFDGTAQGIADGFQGLAGGAAAGLINMGGAAAGAGAALAGIGLVIGPVFDQLQQQAEESAERVRGMYDDMIESGNRYLSEQYILAAGADLLAEKQERIAEIARVTGLTEAEVTRAMVTDGWERNAILERTGELYRRNIDLYNEASDGISGSGGEYAEAANQVGAIAEEFRRLNGEQSTAVQQAETYGEFAELSAERAEQAVNNLTDAITGVPAIEVRADTSRADNDLRLLVNAKRTVWLEARVRDQYGRPQ